MIRCKACINFSQKMSAKTPQKLSALISKVKQGVKDGIFVEINSVVEPFEKINSSGGWPDIIENEFECSSCKKHYVLFADTYHGGNNNGWSESNT